MVGEGRHREIAVNEVFNRWNIQYELPRHITTKYFGKDKNLLGSPWWLFDKSRVPTPEERSQQSNPPSKFHDFDGSIVEIGIYNAIIALLKWDIKPFIKPKVQNHEFSNKICRQCYFSNLDQPKLREFRQGQRARETNDFMTRKTEIVYRNESQLDFDRWQAAMVNDWNRLLPPA